MPSKVFQHPGYLGWTSQGVVAIHADWPAYATEHGVGYALMSLGQFPLGTKFTLLSDIDECFLFVVDNNRLSRKDAYSDSNFHVALWHEDVSALIDASYAVGAEPYGVWAKRRAAELDCFFRQQQGDTWVPFWDPLQEDDSYPRKKVVIDPKGFFLTKAGHAALESILFDERADIADHIMQRARPALSAELFDSAIREACVVLESEMRNAVRTAEFGADLIDRFFETAMASGKLIPAQIKTFRTEVRTTFRFIRNKFAHNLQTVDQVQCYAILSRVSNVLIGVQNIAAVIRRDD